MLQEDMSPRMMG